MDTSMPPIGIWEWEKMSVLQRDRLMTRVQADIEKAKRIAAPLIARVRRDGDRAICKIAQKIDGIRLDPAYVRVREEEYEAAGGKLSEKVRAAIDFSIENVERYHRAMAGSPSAPCEIRQGVRAHERTTPIESVGLYVPQGRGSFPSMLYMLAAPARIAGVGRVVVATPPCRDGSIDPACLYAARRCGVDAVYRVGGAVAVAALTYGTETIEPVAKIIGPGSIWVAAAKSLLSGVVDTGIPAGPSESMILADRDADPWKAALDLAIEAEHGADSTALLVTPDAGLAKKVADYIPHIIARAPAPRHEFLSAVFYGRKKRDIVGTRASYPNGGIILCRDLGEGAEIVNRFAPEHLALRIADADRARILEMIKNAGEILVGEDAAFSLANYAAGPNAVLPTGGMARSWSAVSVEHFITRTAIIDITEEGYRTLRPHTIALADYEQFHTHAAAVKDRDAPYGHLHDADDRRRAR